MSPLAEPVDSPSSSGDSCGRLATGDGSSQARSEGLPPEEGYIKYDTNPWEGRDIHLHLPNELPLATVGLPNHGSNAEGEYEETDVVELPPLRRYMLTDQEIRDIMAESGIGWPETSSDE